MYYSFLNSPVYVLLRLLKFWVHAGNNRAVGYYEKEEWRIEGKGKEELIIISLSLISRSEDERRNGNKASFSLASDTHFPWILLIRFPWHHCLLVCMCPSLPIWSHRHLLILHSLNIKIFKIPPLTAFLPHHLPKQFHSLLWFQQLKTHIISKSSWWNSNFSIQMLTH